MRIEKIKSIASIVSFIIMVIIGVFFSRGSKEVFADFLAENYKCIVVEKPLEKDINTKSFIYPCIGYNNVARKINISSYLFNEIIMVGDTIEKMQGDSIIIIKKRGNVLKFAYSLSYVSKVDTFSVH